MKNKVKFKIGFWHPFGVAAGEPRDCIISRKKREIKKNGWTLWSFQNRPDKTMNLWRNEIKKHGKNVFVFCSDSKGARDPKGKVFYAKQFRFANSDKWKDVPSSIKIPHPFGKKDRASAFIIKAIHEPEKIKTPEGIKWLCMDERWREDRLPTRGEYLIKSVGRCKLRKIYQILELAPPYLAVIKK